jgi:transitional endoplasmic reticulum ATPase
MFSHQNGSLKLSPAQTDAYQFLSAWQKNTPILHLRDSGGRGKTTVLREFQRKTGAHWIDVGDLVSEATQRHPLAIEDAGWQVLKAAIEKHSQIIVDDFNMFFEFATGCSQTPRGSYFEATLKSIMLMAAENNCRLVLGSDGNLPDSFENKDWSTSISEFSVEDYRFLFQQFLGREMSDVDFDIVYRFAPNLSCSRIKYLCHWIKTRSTINTSLLLDFIQSQGMASNIEVSEVQEVGLTDLFGVDDVVEALEDNIIMPLENIKLASELGLTPKRGVMLAGPPGTGKTTIGRALARRLRGKFFLIDGTIISGTDYFYHQINSIFHSAIANAPSIVFIDDSDVIFESGREHGLYRYLLTMLDGLESKSASNVCVIMTAMDLGNIPPALVRSGRIELWLEMKLPDAKSRKALIDKHLTTMCRVDNEQRWPSILARTEGFSGADIKRLVQDAKLQMAVDMTKGRTTKPMDVYLLNSADKIIQSQADYVRAAKRAMHANSDRPRWFNVHPELFEKASVASGSGSTMEN